MNIVYKLIGRIICFFNGHEWQTDYRYFGPDDNYEIFRYCPCCGKDSK